MLRIRAASCLLAVVALAIGGVRPLAAEDREVLRVPTIDGIHLDGELEDPAWADAASVAFPAVDVPVPGPERTVRLAPDVKLGLSEGRLALAVSMAEDPGGSIGCHLFVAPADARSAADAVSIDVRPMELRAPRYRAIGPRGVGRTHYRVEAAVEASRAGRWTLEVAVPMADLVGEAATARLRMALVVYTRTQNVISTWPRGATWQGPDRWTEIAPPADGWPLDATVDAARIAAEDAADARRQAAWLDYLRGAATPVLPVKPRAELQAELQANLIDPLQAVRAHRPDLGVPVDVVLGDIYHRLGFPAQAEARYEAALDASPGWREAGYGLYVKVRGTAAATGAPNTAGDVTLARERMPSLFDPKARPASASYARDGRALAEALLAYKLGDAQAARPVLERLAARYPFDAFIDAHRRLAIRLARAAGEEARRVQADAKATLPRATIETTQGTVVLELFHDDARNTVFNFVWIAKHGFYDGCSVHRSIPFFCVQTGDPFSREVSSRPALVGSGTPGYAIRTEVGPRWPLRGYVALAHGGPDTDGSQFMIFTGTAVHLRGELTVFARVVEGMDVVDRLQAGGEEGVAPDRILKVTVSGLDPERTYQPNTLAGNRAPPPRLPAVRGDPK